MANIDWTATSNVGSTRVAGTGDGLVARLRASIMDFSFLQTAGFWTVVVGIPAAVAAFLTGRSTARKTDAEAHKVEVEADMLSAREVQSAEERLHDRALSAMTKLADMYERNLASMQKTLDQMESEVDDLRRENLKLQSTVDTLTQDNDRLRDLVIELQTHVQTLIVALRHTKHELPALPDVMSGYDDPDDGLLAKPAQSPGDQSAA